MTERRTYQRDIIEETLKAISQTLHEDTDVFLIGGGAMTFYGRKAATKDIDVVFTDAASLQRFRDVASTAGFKPVSEPEKEYRNIGAWIILEDHRGLRLDLFHRQVCNALELTDTMKARATHLMDLGFLHVHLVAPEDIVLFKGITERQTDLEDIRILAEAGIDWATVEEECLTQKNSGRWANLLLYKLDELRTRYGIRPRVNRIRDHADQHVLEETFRRVLGDKELTFKEIHEAIQMKTGYSESWTRAKLKQLEETGTIKTRKTGKHKLYRLEPI